MFICWWWVSLCLVLYHSPHMYHENLEIVEARSACDVRLRAVCFLVKVLLLLAWLVCVCLTVLGFVYCGWPLLYITWCRWKKTLMGGIICLLLRQEIPFTCCSLEKSVTPLWLVPTLLCNGLLMRVCVSVSWIWSHYGMYGAVAG